MNQLIVAISGAHGFIGKHLVQLVERLGHKVIPLNRFGTPVQADILFDLAGYGNLYHQKDTNEMYRANFERSLKQIIHSEFESCVYISTSSVLLPVQTDYSISKKMAQDALVTYAKFTNRPISIVQPYTVIGVGEPEEHLIPKLINACLTGKEVPFVPEPVHDFVNVDDFVRALWLVAKEKKVGEIYEVGSGKTYTNQEVKETVERLTGVKIKTKLVKSMRSYDNTKWLCKSTKMKRLGWVPEKNIDDSIKEMCAGYF